MQGNRSSAYFSAAQRGHNCTHDNLLKKVLDAQKEAERLRGVPPRRRGGPRKQSTWPSTTWVTQAADHIYAAQEVATAAAFANHSHVADQIAEAQWLAHATVMAANFQWNPEGQAQLASDIRAAQLHARCFANPIAKIKAAQRAAARLRGEGSGDLHMMQFNAQLKGIPAAQRKAMAAPKWSSCSPAVTALAESGCFDCEGNLQPTGQMFIGNWLDGAGNQICVYSTDAWEMKLVASMSRPNGLISDFPLRCTEEGMWFCGKNSLDVFNTTIEELRWLTPEGRVAVWSRARE